MLGTGSAFLYHYCCQAVPSSTVKLPRDKNWCPFSQMPFLSPMYSYGKLLFILQNPALNPFLRGVLPGAWSLSLFVLFWLITGVCWPLFLTRMPMRSLNQGPCLFPFCLPSINIGLGTG